jgi:hypothetical protein
VRAAGAAQSAARPPLTDSPFPPPPSPPPRLPSCPAVQCLAALGGGNINTKRGDFPRVQVAGCSNALATYISSGAYLRGIDIAAKSAWGPLGLAPEARAARAANESAAAADALKRRKQLVVFGAGREVGAAAAGAS